jgi:transposase-like protein
MLLTLDPSTTSAELAAGALSCPDADCHGELRPWGHARRRLLRLGPGRSEAQRPRRARCRTCKRTHVIASARSYPRRPDSVETVGSALLAAAGGVGHRQIAEGLGLPATTVRGWVRRARANAETVRISATVAVHALDPLAGPLAPAGSELRDMLEAVGQAVAAAVRRLGPRPVPWQLAVALTGGGILAPRRPQTWTNSG